MNLNKMKIWCFLLVAIISALYCHASENANFYWYVAASLSKPAKEIAEKYNNQHSDLNVFVVTGGSGELISQIILSGKGDLFTPASDEFMTIIRDKKIIRSYRKLLKQTPVFALARKYIEKRLSFEEFVKCDFKLAIGNPKTMALALSYLVIEKKFPPVVAKRIREEEVGFPLDINQSLSYLETNTLDAALLFDSVAKSHKLSYVEIPKEYNVENYAYLVALNSESSEKNTNDFISFIFENKEVLKNIALSYSKRRINDI